MQRRTSPQRQEISGASGYVPISDYAFVGDCHGAALISRDGSADWCCLQRFDAEPVFNRILDAGKGGFFQISPEAEYKTRRGYVGGTHVLETSFLAEGGSARLVDFMPLASAGEGQAKLKAGHRLVRIVEGVHGVVSLRARYRPARGFAEGLPDLAVANHTITASGCPSLASNVTFHIEADEAVARFDIKEGSAFASSSAGASPVEASFSLRPLRLELPLNSSGAPGAVMSPMSAPTGTPSSARHWF